MTERQFSPKLVMVQLVEKKKGTWGKPGDEQIKGIEYLYQVSDENMLSHKRWRFAIQIADSTGEISVVPEDCPKKKAYGDLTNRSVMFMDANQEKFDRFMYCKVFLSDPTGVNNRKGVRYDKRKELPYWFGDFPKSHSPTEAISPPWKPKSYGSRLPGRRGASQKSHTDDSVVFRHASLDSSRLITQEDFRNLRGRRFLCAPSRSFVPLW